MTKLFATDATKEKYKIILDQTLPDLQGYNEVHIITEEDFKKFNHQKKENPLPSDFRGLLGDSKLFKAFEGEEKQKELLKTFDFISSHKRERDSTGDASFSLEGNIDGKAYRLGVVFLMGDAEAKFQEFFIPHGLNKDDKQKTSKLNTFQHIKTKEDFLLAHEIGHLVNNLKINNFNLDPSEGEKGKLHQAEVASDAYARKIIGDNDLSKVLLNTRTLKGVWELVVKPEGHFTTPFLPGGILEKVSFEDAIKAGKNISDAIEQKIKTVFSENKDSVANKHFEDLDRDDFAQFCTGLAIDKQNRYEALNKMSDREKILQRQVGNESPPNLKESFFQCAAEKFDFRTHLLSSVRYEFPMGTLERAILDHYMDSLGEYRQMLTSVSNPNSPAPQAKQPLIPQDP